MVHSVGGRQDNLVITGGRPEQVSFHGRACLGTLLNPSCLGASLIAVDLAILMT
jgi:hypothetical protein